MATRTSMSLVAGLLMFVATTTVSVSQIYAEELPSVTLALMSDQATLVGPRVATASDSNGGKLQRGQVVANDDVSYTRLSARLDVNSTPHAVAAASQTSPARPVVSQDRGSFRPGRPASLVPLYALVATLNVLDAHSTFRALDAGAREANPLMAPFARNKGAMLALKAGVTASTILFSERMWREGKRKTAVVMLAALSVANALVVQHNYRVGSSLR